MTFDGGLYIGGIRENVPTLFVLSKYMFQQNFDTDTNQDDTADDFSTFSPATTRFTTELYTRRAAYERNDGNHGGAEQEPVPRC